MSLKTLLPLALIGAAASLQTGCATTDPGPSETLYQKQAAYQKSQIPGPHGGPGADAELAARGKGKP